MIQKSDIRSIIGVPLYESEKLACCLTDDNLDLVFVNKAFENVTGFLEEEVLGKSISLLLTTESYDTSEHGPSEFRQIASLARTNWFIQNKDGGKMETSVEYHQIQINGERYQLIVAVDVTHVVQEQVKLSEERYRQLTETLPHILWTSDKEGFVQYINQTGMEYLGLTEFSADEWTWAPYFHPDEKDMLYEKWEKAFKNKEALHALHRLKRYDGTFRWFQVIVFPQLDNKNEFISWTGVCTDVDERINALDSLKITNTRLRSLINASPIAIYSINTKGIVQDFWNPAAERMLGWKKEEVVGRFLPHVRDDHKDEFFNLIKKTQESGQLNAQAVRKDRAGNDIILDITGGCVYNEKGEVSEILVTVMDVTEIEKNRKRLNKSLNEKETLLQEIHHRVKNNLAIVVSLLQLQVFRSADENEKYRLTEAQNRVHSIAMVHELLYQSEDFNNVDLHTYYDKLIGTIKSNMLISGKNVDHTLDISIHSLNINQAIPLGLLVNELVTNSLKYAFSDSEKGNKIDLTIKPDKEDIIVDYSDNGSGFDMSATNFASGLGMKIIDSLLHQLQATYEIKSEDGFSINFKFHSNSRGPHSNLN